MAKRKADAASTTQEQPKKVIGKPFPAGVSGNPKGRPKGSRDALGFAFVEALYADFQEHGEATIHKVREDMPHQYLKTIAMILPKELNHNINNMSDMSDAELGKLLDAVRSLVSQATIEAPGSGSEAAGGSQQTKGVRTLQ